MSMGRKAARSSGAIALVSGVAAMALMAAGPAKADVQSDVAAIKAENAELREMVKSLKQDMQILQKTIAKTSEVVASPKTPPKMATSGNENVSLTVAGQVNRMLFYADDGDQAQLFNADNDYSSTRLTITGKAKVTEDISVSAVVEGELESNSTDRVVISQDRADNTNAGFRERKYEVIGESKTFGRISAGQGSTASDGTAEVILSGTQVIAGSGIDAMGNQILFLREDNNASSGRRISALFANFDGLSRDDRIRYDSPSLAGFTLSSSYSDGDRWDAALRYKNKFSFGEIEAAASYFDARSTGTLNAAPTGFSGVAFSAAYEAPFGTNIGGAFSNNDFEANRRDTAQFWYFMLGQDLKLLELGETSFAIDYAHTDDQAINGSSGNYWSLTAVQQIKKAATELYFKVGQFDAELPGPNRTDIDLEDITFAGLGARVKF